MRTWREVRNFALRGSGVTYQFRL